MVVVQIPSRPLTVRIVSAVHKVRTTPNHVPKHRSAVLDHAVLARELAEGRPVACVCWRCDFNRRHRRGWGQSDRKLAPVVERAERAVICSVRTRYSHIAAAQLPPYSEQRCARDVVAVARNHRPKARRWAREIDRGGIGARHGLRQAPGRRRRRAARSPPQWEEKHCNKHHGARSRRGVPTLAGTCSRRI